MTSKYSKCGKYEQKNSCQNMSTWDLVLNILSKQSQQRKRIIDRINGLGDKSF